LEELGVWNAAMIQPGRQPLDYLRELAASHRAIVVHGGYLDDGEIHFIAENRKHMGIVYCPRTHQWFGRRPYPLETMLAAGVPVALGTDGRGSSPDLNMVAEIRCAAQHHPSIPLGRVLRMGTLDGARVLGCDGETGSLTPGKRADLTVIALPRRDASDPHDLLFDAGSYVSETITRGGYADAPGNSGSV
jgi:aminodeoxyfutalosine deaminase